MDNFILKQTIFTKKKRIKLVEVSKWHEFSFEIEEKLLVLSENDKGWTKELNRVSFNGAPAKYDNPCMESRPHQDGQGDYPKQRGIPSSR